jgi:hypothetical protein
MNLDLLCRIIPTDVSNGLELICEAGHRNSHNGKILKLLVAH